MKNRVLEYRGRSRGGESKGNLWVKYSREEAGKGKEYMAEALKNEEEKGAGGVALRRYWSSPSFDALLAQCSWSWSWPVVVLC
jgi:hypothetical protein